MRSDVVIVAVLVGAFLVLMVPIWAALVFGEGLEERKRARSEEAVPPAVPCQWE